MTETNNRSARGLDDQGQADASGVERRKLFHIEPREVIPYRGKVIPHRGGRASERYSTSSLDDRGSGSRSRVTTLQLPPF